MNLPFVPTSMLRLLPQRVRPALRCVNVSACAAPRLRTTLTVATALSLIAANFGLPGTLLRTRARVAPLQPVAVATLSNPVRVMTAASADDQQPRCCCAKRQVRSACCCSHKQASAKKSCCQSKSPATVSNASLANQGEESPGHAVVSCPCGDAPGNDFVGTGPLKFVKAAAPATAPDRSVAHTAVASSLSPGSIPQPELPPPRLSAC